MKRIFCLVFLPLCLTSCGDSVSSSDKYVSLGSYTGEDGTIELYDGEPRSYMTFSGGIARMVGYSENNNTGKYEKSYIACVYYNIEDGLIFMFNSSYGSQWFELYDGKTEKEYQGDSYYVTFKKPERPKTGYVLWGEMGNGWIKEYSSGTGGVKNDSFTLHVTVPYAKKVGISVYESVYKDGQYVQKK